MACPTLPTHNCEERIDQIESVLRRALGHPQCAPSRQQPKDDGPSPEQLFSSPLMARLRVSLDALSSAGTRLGAMPEGYPLWAALVIRGVSALLPWYTRSLHAYARAVAETATVTAAILEDAERRAREAAR
jgi:hypothetical protein